MKKKSALLLLLCLGIAGMSVDVSAKSKVDPLLNKKEANYQYQFKAINIKKAWDLLEKKGYTQTKVGVMDTGVDPEHEDLKHNLADYVSIKKGIIKKGTEDIEEHGTHVSGIIAAEYGNGKGGSGVAVGYKNDMAKLYVAGVSDDDGNMNSIDMEKAIGYFKSKGVRVVNMSLGGYDYDDDIQKLMKKAYDDGMILVSASGNEDTDKKSSPASFKEVISVNASDSKNNIVSFSDYGYATDVSAPGFALPSTLPGNRYVQMSGTSMSCPVVAGVASLVLSANKDLTPKQVYNIICGSANKSKMNGAFFDKNQYAYGVVDAYEAVKAAYEMKENPVNRVDNIFIKNKVFTVSKGYKEALEIMLTPYTSTVEVTWSSSDESVATVDNDGYIEGKKEGRATITAKAGDKTVSCLLNVQEEVLPEAITVRKKANIISEGQTDNISVRVSPKEALVKDWYVKSSNEGVAVGLPNIGVYGEKEGRVTITVRTINNLETSYELVVKPAVSKVKWIKKTEKIKSGKKFRFVATALNSKNTEDLLKRGVTWSVSDETLATIDKNGLFTAKKSGKVFVKVTSKGLGKDGKNNVSRVVAVKITKGKDVKNVKKVSRNSKRIKVKAQHLLDEEEDAKSQALELVSNVYSIIDAKRSKYSDAVLKSVDTLRKEVIEYINSTNDYDLYKEEYNSETDKYEPKPIGKFKDYMGIFAAIEEYTNLETGYVCNFKKIKNDVYERINKSLKELDHDTFNEYYEQVVKNIYHTALRKVKKAKTILDLAKAESKIPTDLGNDMEFTMLNEVTDFEKIYTASDIKYIKKLAERQIVSYKNQLKMKKRKIDKKTDAEISKYKKDIKRTLFAGEIINNLELYLNNLVKKTGIKYEILTAGEKNRVYSEVDKVLKKYDINKYSTEKWEKIKDIMQETYDRILSAKYKGEIYNIKTETDKKLKKVKEK